MTEIQNPANKTIRISLIEDSYIHLEWLKLELSDDPLISVVSEDMSGRQGIESVQKHKPDLVILDFQLRDISGLEVSKRIKIREPNIRIFVLTAHNEISIIERVIQDKNIDGVAIKGSRLFENHFLKIIHQVAAGNTFLDPSLLMILRENSDEGGLKQLTPREFEVFIQVHSGKSDVAIAEDMCIDIRAFRNMKSRIGKKIKIGKIRMLVEKLVENAE